MYRGALYFFFDKEGVVDDYNIYLLEDLKKNLDYLLIVVNGSLTEEGRAKFETVADDIFQRNNTGFDVWAYKEGIEYINWSKLREFDEFIFLNHTNYGPVYPFNEMFSEMDRRSLDFWGITKHFGHDYDPYNRCEYGFIPPHIQSSFIVVRKSMLNSYEFKDYWVNMQEINSYEDSICKHEAVFTEKFSRLGFKSDVYIDTEDLKEYSDYPLMMYAKELVKNRRCPIFKRKTFFNIYEEFMDVSIGQTAVELYDFLRNETNYDVNMIWTNLLRTSNMYDIKQRMQLNYIIPSDVIKKRESPNPKIALFMHIYYLDMLEYCRYYANNMPPYADIYLTTDSEEKKKIIEVGFSELKDRKVTVVVVENRGREYAGFFIGLKPYFSSYDYICISHGKKSLYDKPYIIGESFTYHCFENTLGSSQYVENLITLFENNPRLGLLVPPTPNHGPYYSTIGREWKGNFTKTKELSEMLRLKANFDATKPPIAPFGGFFWLRTDALSKLFMNEFQYSDFPEEPCYEKDGTFMHALERIYPFVAQDAGFYSAWSIKDTYCEMLITNMYKTVRDFNEGFFWKYGESDRHTVMTHLYTDLMASSSNINLSKKERLKIILKIALGQKRYAKLKKIIRRLI